MLNILNQFSVSHYPQELKMLAQFCEPVWFPVTGCTEWIEQYATNTAWHSPRHVAAQDELEFVQPH